MSGILLSMIGRGSSRAMIVGTAGFRQGFYSPGSAGSLSPTEFLGQNITGIYYNTDTGVESVHLLLSGTHNNSGFTSMTVGGVVYLRTDIDEFHNTPAEWIWKNIPVNPFPTDGVYFPVDIA